MEITLTTPFQINWTDSLTGQTEQKTITKLEVAYIQLDYKRQAIILASTYKDNEGFRASSNHSAFGDKAVNPFIDGTGYATLEAAGVNQSEVYSYLQGQHGFLAGTVS